MNRKWLIGFIVVVVAFALIHSSGPKESSSRNVITPTGTSSTGDNVNSDSSTTEADPPTFAGSPCTSDCSGHEAGYNWAEENGIDDEDDCDTAGDNSDSPSFAEGCKAYVNGESKDEDDSDQDNSDD